MAALTLGAVRPVPSHGAEALAAGARRGFHVDAFAVAAAVLVVGALVFELATVSVVERVAPAAARDGPPVAVAILRVLRSFIESPSIMNSSSIDTTGRQQSHLVMLRAVLLGTMSTSAQLQKV